MRATLVALVVLCACDGGEGGDVDLDSLDEGLIDAICDVYVRCGLISDDGTCQSFFDDELQIEPDLKAAIDAGLIVFDAAKANECLAGIRALSCEGFRGLTNPACDETFRGTVAGGGPCAMNDECVSKDCDIPACPESCCRGTCVGDAPPQRGGPGSTCTSSSHCIDSWCDFGAMQCMPLVPNDMPCQSNNACMSGACVASTCRATAPSGGACANMPCAHIGEFCSPTTQRCTPFGLLDDACDASSPCSEIYSCTNGSCALGPRLGDPCTDVGDCIDASYCDQGTSRCTARKADGESCTEEIECRGSCNLTTMRCETPPICF